MTYNYGLRISDKKWIKTRMKTLVHLNSKGNEIIVCCSLSIWSYFLLSNYHCCMCCCRQCSLHYICASWVSNEDIHQGPKTIFDVKDIHLLGVTRKKVKNVSVNMCFTFQNNRCNNISKCNMGCCYMFIPIGTKKQMVT
jgi:hypothetical protein